MELLIFTYIEVYKRPINSCECVNRIEITGKSNEHIVSLLQATFKKYDSHRFDISTVNCMYERRVF